MLSAKQAADQLGVSLSLVYQLCHDLVLKHYRLGGRGKRGRIRIEEAEVERFRNNCRREERPPVVPPLRHLTLD